MASLRLAIILAMAVALGPFAFDTYLPSFPSIAEGLHTDIDNVGYSVSVYIFGLAFGQLIGGPLSDRYGRAKIMLTGLVLFSVASIMIACSHSLSALIVWRIIQSFGGGWCAVSVPAIVRDRVEGQEAARLFSLIAQMMIVAPAIAPMVGSIILTVANWRGIFVFIAAYAVLVIVLLRLYLFSEPAPIKPVMGKITFFSSYVAVIKNPVAIYLILLQAFAFSIMMIFLTNASFIYQEWFGVSKFVFAVFFFCNIAMMGFLAFINRLLLRRFAASLLLSLAVVLQTLAVLVLVGIVYFHDYKLILFVPALMVTVGSMGVISPNNQACYLQFFKHNSATAAALMGALQLTVAGCMSALSAWMGNHTLRPIVLLMALCATLSLLMMLRSIIVLRKNKLIETGL
ncbi:MAG TPA: multidrug effflux MFS transporter [Gammaproteobacteria bacterium]|nr:multidrug effflux MFS transporter [Gammaproteobacteria bacterium]